jgi:hypothetical protein
MHDFPLVPEPADVVALHIEWGNGRPDGVIRNPETVAACLELLKPRADDGIVGILTTAGVSLRLRSGERRRYHRNVVARWDEIVTLMRNRLEIGG